jgi:fructose-specific phosphotransferase system IIC component
MTDSSNVDKVETALVVRSSNVGLDQGTKRFVVVVTVLVSSFIALMIISTVSFMPYFRQGYQVPDVLQNWGGLIIGFYFGTFLSLLKDWSRESVEIQRPEK